MAYEVTNIRIKFENKTRIILNYMLCGLICDKMVLSYVITAIPGDTIIPRKDVCIICSCYDC